MNCFLVAERYNKFGMHEQCIQWVAKISNFFSWELKNCANLPNIHLGKIDCKVTKKSLVLLMESFLCLGEFFNAANIYRKIVEFRGIFESECEDEKQIFALGYISHVFEKNREVIVSIGESLQMLSELKLESSKYLIEVLAKILTSNQFK